MLSIFLSIELIMLLPSAQRESPRKQVLAVQHEDCVYYDTVDDAWPMELLLLCLRLNQSSKPWSQVTSPPRNSESIGCPTATLCDVFQPRIMTPATPASRRTDSCCSNRSLPLNRDTLELHVTDDTKAWRES